MTNTETITKEVGATLKQIRKSKKISLKQLSMLVHCNYNNVGRLFATESGENSPSIITLAKILNALDIELTEFFKLVNKK